MSADSSVTETLRFPSISLTHDDFAPMAQGARSNGLFRGLTDADAETVLSYCRYCVVNSGVTIIEEGTQADFMMFVAEGQLNVTRTDPVGQKVSLGTVSIGAILGESAITDRAVRFASVQTATRCAVGVLYRDAFRRMSIAHPETALALVTSLFNQTNQRLRNVAEQLVKSVAVRSAAEQTVELLSKVLFDRRSAR